MGSIPGSGRFPGEGNGNRLQYSGQGNFMGGRLQSIGPQKVRQDCDFHFHKATLAGP